ncbi:MAG: adenylate/guanylate cyclase domain-containing protein [Chloroflexota bacterium]
MSTDFQRALIQKERELQLVTALDRVRDTLHDDEDPQGMFDAIAAYLKEEFQAEACAIMLVAETSDDIDSISAAGLPQNVAIDLCRQAMQYPDASNLKDAPWPHTIGIQIFLEDFPLGGLVVARSSEPFHGDEIVLLSLVESQLDSAVIQARMVWKLTQRNRELEAIYEIDRLRDRTSSEADLISGFTTILLEHFEADLCMILLTQADSGEMVVRGIIDKHDVPASAIDAIREKARQLTIPQVIPTPNGIDDLLLLAAPFIVAGARLGAVVIGSKIPYTLGDHRLLHAMMTQMDSAVVYSRILQQLSQRKKELEIIYRIDRIRDQEKDFDAMLQAVLTELCEAVSSEMGYIMLYKENNEKELQLRSFTSDGLLASGAYQEIIQRTSRNALAAGEMIYSNEPEGPIRSILAMPLILNERIIGVFGVVNSTFSRGFDAEDRRMLNAITSQVDTAIFERLEQRRMRALLSRSVDPKVVEHLLQRADADILAGERVILTVIFADLRGSTEWAERTPAEELVSSLNAFLGQMTEVIFKYGGTLDKFVGDEVIGLFGTPLPMEDHAYRAASAALEMQRVHTELQETFRQQGRELPMMGVGVSSGEAIAGEFGHPIRSEFTALGRIINLGSRICGEAKGGQVLITHTTYDMIQPLATANELAPVMLKGITQATPIYELVSVKS